MHSSEEKSSSNILTWKKENMLDIYVGGFFLFCLDNKQRACVFLHLESVVY